LICGAQLFVGSQMNEEEFFGRADRIGWNHPAFDVYREIIAEEEKFLIEPPQMEEGIIACRKCKSKKTTYYQRQIRRADEGFTLFITCLSCGEKWREN